MACFHREKQKVHRVKTWGQALPIKFVLSMLRILIAILFFFSGASLIAEHCKAYSHGIVLFSENEDNGGTGSEPEKAKEENLGEKLFYSQFTWSSASIKISGMKPTYEQPLLTPGFTDRPYLPPDLT